MKCKGCLGTGMKEFNVTISAMGCEIKPLEKCELCNGRSFVEPLTNDEWRRTCSTEEFAEWIFEVYMTDKHHLFDRIESAEYEQANSGKQEIMKWLKEKHTP